MQIAEIKHHSAMPTIFMPTPLTANQQSILDYLKITPLSNVESATNIAYKLLFSK